MSVRPRKLVVQIPAWDEAQTLPLTLADLPRQSSVPVQTNPATRPSRLFGSPWVYVGRTGPLIPRLWLTA